MTDDIYIYIYIFIRIIPNIGSGSTKAPGWDDTQTRNEENAIKQALTQDIQDGIIGAEFFTPKHVMIITWRNVTFNGGTYGTKTIVSTTTETISKEN